MTATHRRTLRIVGAIGMGLGLAIAGVAVSTVFVAYLTDSQCPPSDPSCRAGPLFLRLAIFFVGQGTVVMGIGWLVRRHGRARPGDPPFVSAPRSMDRATKRRVAATAFVFGASAACWAFGLKLWSLFAFMGALFAVTTVLMQRRKLL